MILVIVVVIIIGGVGVVVVNVSVVIDVVVVVSRLTILYKFKTNGYTFCYVVGNLGFTICIK